MLVRRLSFVGAALLLACAARDARADEGADAQALFQEGKALLESGKTAEACDKFAAAASISWTVGVRLNLASCYEKVGRVASAWTRYNEAFLLAQRTGNAAAAQMVRARQSPLADHLSFVAIKVSKEAAALADLDLRVDGECVPRFAWGAPVAIDPGDHEIRVTAPGHKTWTKRVTIAGPDAREEVPIPALEAEAAPSSEEPVADGTDCAKLAAIVDATPTALANLQLAACYRAEGRMASAWARYDDAFVLAMQAGSTPIAERARASQSELIRRLSLLTVTIPSDVASLPDLRVFRDGQPLPRSAWGVPMAVDPGEHVISAMARGREAWTARVDISGEDAPARVTVPVLGETAVATAPSAGFFRGPGGAQRALAATSAGLGAVALGVGTYFGLRMLAEKRGYEEHLGPDGRCVDASCASSNEAALAHGNAATAGFVAGGALIGAGAALWLTAPKTASITPTSGLRGAGVAGAW
jgi:tetratricopeptide (TPR) repeat protein